MRDRAVDPGGEAQSEAGPPSEPGRAASPLSGRGRRLLPGRRSGLGRGQEPLSSEDEAGLTATDPRTLLQSLESNDRFRRDTGLGAIYHPGKQSFREVRPTNSMHIIIDGDRVSAHIDEISPFKLRSDGSIRYSLSRIAAHNLAGISNDFVRLIRGRLGRQRCKLECERVWVDDEPPSESTDLATSVARPEWWPSS